jgi:TRAP-type transport system small permease protein
MKDFANLNVVWRALGYLSALVFLVITVLISYNVVARLVFENPLSWIPEVSRHLMIWLAFLASAVALRLRGHLGLDVLSHVDRRWVKIAIEIIVTAVVLSVAYVMIKYGWQMVGRVSRQTSSALGYSMAYAYAAIPTGGVLMVIAALDSLRERLTTLWKRP